MCRDARVIHPNPDLYNRANRKLVEEFKRKLPVVELEKEGKLFFDYSGLENLYGDIKSFSSHFKNEIHKKLRLKSNIGLSTSKLVSKTVSNSMIAERGVSLIEEGQESDFLCPFPNEIIPPVKELKKKSGRLISNIFDDLNLELVSDLRAFSQEALQVIFKAGKVDHSATVFEMVRGLDYRPVVPIGEFNSIFDEYLFDMETNNRILIYRYCHSLISKTTEQLRGTKKWAKDFKLSVRYSDFKFREKIIRTKQYFRSADDIEELALAQLDKLLDRRVRIRYISLELLNLSTVQVQLSLFDIQTESKRLSSTIGASTIGSSTVDGPMIDAALEATMDKINQRFKGKIGLGKGFVK